MQTLASFLSINQQLTSAIHSFQTEGLPHSLLISGQKGTGKSTLALLLSQMVLCSSDAQSRPCGTCSNCIRVASYAHPSFLTVGLDRKESSVKIEDIRGIVEKLSRYSIESGKRVVLLLDADRMTVQAQNALLKSLEEPDMQTHFILTSSSRQNLLPTVLSRCLQISMPLWSEEQIYNFLLKENIKDAKNIASLSEGSIGKALRYSSDNRLHEIISLIDQTIDKTKHLSEIPVLSAEWKNLKDEAELVIDILESRCNKYLKKTSDKQRILQLNKMLDSLIQAQKLLKSNVSWQAVADYLLFHILEDINSCHQ